MSFHISRACAFALSLIAIACQPFGSAIAQDCFEFGKPSYTANRVLEIDGKTFKSKVFISGDREREDTEINGKTVIRVRVDRDVTTFDMVTKTGFRVKLPPLPKPGEAKKDPNVTLLRDEAGDLRTLTMQVRQGEKLYEVLRMICRTDGALLEKRYPTPVKPGQSAVATLRQTEIELGPISDALFVVPGDVKITVAPPPPKPK